MKLTIDAGELILAMHSNVDFDATWYLDKESGEVLLDRDENGEVIEAMADDPRYLRIELIPSHEAFGVMEDFVDELDDELVAQKLSQALSGRKPFRAFKDALFDFPEVRVAWFAFEEEADLRRAREWCENHGIIAEWKMDANLPENPP